MVQVNTPQLRGYDHPDDSLSDRGSVKSRATSSAGQPTLDSPSEHSSNVPLAELLARSHRKSGAGELGHGKVGKEAGGFGVSNGAGAPPAESRFKELFYAEDAVDHFGDHTERSRAELLAQSSRILPRRPVTSVAAGRRAPLSAPAPSLKEPLFAEDAVDRFANRTPLTRDQLLAYFSYLPSRPTIQQYVACGQSEELSAVGDRFDEKFKEMLTTWGKVIGGDAINEKITVPGQPTGRSRDVSEKRPMLRAKASVGSLKSMSISIKGMLKRALTSGSHRTESTAESPTAALGSDTATSSAQAASSSRRANKPGFLRRQLSFNKSQNGDSTTTLRNPFRKRSKSTSNVLGSATGRTEAPPPVPPLPKDLSASLLKR
ncbi:hypothetical protein DFQ28_004795 [Apophysomyces sp. BC1034]|nr:hypothetical protein DFQ30_000364 [Apophysomyces sp. BC1015]KAG0188455.1 hypothetical protein DFQ28_004795 [Apophysomyces sp. BC1034]